MRSIKNTILAGILMLGTYAIGGEVSAYAGAYEKHLVTPSHKAVYLNGEGAGVEPLSFRWIVDGEYAGDGQRRWHNLTKDGDHQIALEVTDAEGDKATDITYVHVTHNPGEDMLVLAGDDTTLHVTESSKAIYLSAKVKDGVKPITYKWYEGDKYIGDGQSRWYQLTEDGMHQIKVEATDSFGNSSTDSKIVFVTHEQANPVISADAGPDKEVHLIDRDQVVLIRGRGIGNDDLEYKWFLDDQVIGQNQTLEFKPEHGGEYIIKLEVTDNYGTTAEDTMKLTVIDHVIDTNETTAFAGVYKKHLVTPSNKAIYLHGRGTGVEPITYKWRVDGKYVGGGSSRWYNLTEDGDHQITLEVTDAEGNTAIDTTSVHVTHNPGEDISVFAGDDTTLHITESVKAVYLSAEVKDGVKPITYKWYDGDKYIGNGKARWYEITKDGVYNIRVVATDSLGNVATDSKLVTATHQ